MFTGAINSDVKSVLHALSQEWGGENVNIVCSGNFTIERILSTLRSCKIHGNDVSLYSSVIGGYLTGKNIEVRLSGLEEYQWLERYLTPGIDTVATMMLCTKVFPCISKQPAYYKRILKAYMAEWPALHKKTCTKILPILDDELCLSSYNCEDGFDFAMRVPNDSVVITYPPTYKGGYERLYKKFDEAFVWNKPKYVMFNEARLEELFKICMSKDRWVVIRDIFVEEWNDYIVGKIQTSIRSKPVYVYSNEPNKKYLSVTRQKIDSLPIKRLQGEIQSPIKLMEISQGQMNLLRSEYLSKHIAPASAVVRFAVVCGGELVGAVGFVPSKYTNDAAYMMTDFAISPTGYKRLSKLVLSAVISKEMRDVLEQRFNSRITKIQTTAFTKKAISMKYRGLFEIHSKKNDMINYESLSGRWTLEEGYRWWMETQSQVKI